jgi:hypothetical protein
MTEQNAQHAAAPAAARHHAPASAGPLSFTPSPMPPMPPQMAAPGSQAQPAAPAAAPAPCNCGEQLEGLEGRFRALADDSVTRFAKVDRDLAVMEKLTRATGWLSLAVCAVVAYIVWSDRPQPAKPAKPGASP